MCVSELSLRANDAAVVHGHLSSKLEQTLDARLVITSSARVPDATRWEFISKAGKPPVRYSPPVVKKKKEAKFLLSNFGVSKRF